MKSFVNFSEIEEKKKFYETLKSLQGQYEITLKKVKPIRSTSQNAYYWSVVLPCVLEAVNNEGNEWDLDELHDFLKNEFLKDVKVIMIDNLEKKCKIVKSSAELDTKEFSEYIDKIVRWAAEQLGCEVPVCI